MFEGSYRPAPQVLLHLGQDIPNCPGGNVVYDRFYHHRSSVDEQWVFNMLDHYATSMGAPDYAETAWATPYSSKYRLSWAEINTFYTVGLDL